ncbi:hypothetical protein [Streptomyces bluensis]|uniref:Large membrane protein n=1 Tax=Streptomyces bluensis TaxID=33897 RepID=A0ABW6UJX2_9ACTN
MSTERPDNDAKPDATEAAEAKGDSGDAKGAEEPAGPGQPARPEEPAGPEVPSAGGSDVSAGAAEGVEEVGVKEVNGVEEVKGVKEVKDVEGPVGDDEPKVRRGRSSVLIASVAAAVLLVGGGGAYLTASTTGGSGGGSDSGAPAGDGTPPPLALDGYTEGGTNGIAPGEPHPNGVTYRADGTLPAGPDSAPVYRSAGDVTSAEVARLAKALGVEGTPKIEGGTWKVGASKDGSGPSLQVNKDAPGTWTFSRYAPGTDNCRKADVCASAPGTAAGGDPVSEAAAKEAAAPVLKAVGQDAAKLDATQVAGAVRTVNAEPEVGGLPTYGWTTGIQVGADGQVTGGSGNVKTPVKGDTYPVVGADRALDLMNGRGQDTGGSARKGIGGCASPVPLKGGDEASCEAATATPAPEPVTVVDDAVFGLAARFTEGQPVLVPSWLFQVRPEGAGAGFTVTHPAVDPAYLTAPEPPSAVTPSPLTPGEPSGSAPKTRNVPVEGYTVKGKDLTVSFWGGVCGEYSASADEANGKVTVTVTEKPSGKVCILIAKAMERTVRLDRPLDGREVVGTNGKEIPKGSLTDRAPSAR